MLLSEARAIVVDESGATSVPGIFAAGEGAKTALAVSKFLSQTLH